MPLPIYSQDMLIMLINFHLLFLWNFQTLCTQVFSKHENPLKLMDKYNLYTLLLHGHSTLFCNGSLDSHYTL